MLNFQKNEPGWYFGTMHNKKLRRIEAHIHAKGPSQSGGTKMNSHIARFPGSLLLIRMLALWSTKNQGVQLQMHDASVEFRDPDTCAEDSLSTWNQISCAAKARPLRKGFSMTLKWGRLPPEIRTSATPRSHTCPSPCIPPQSAPVTLGLSCFGVLELNELPNSY